MTREELAGHDGKEGRRAYVAVSGKVYDFTDSALWRHGSHVKQHQAGTDLTEDLLKAPHVRAVVERYPVVAELEETVKKGTGSRFPLLAMTAMALLVAVTLFLILGR
jgi:predicted heme/steroid binding protein